MKYFLLLLALPFFSFVSLRESADDFDKQLNDVTADFKTNIFEKSKCTAASQKAGEISASIKDLLDGGDIEKSEIKKLEGLKKEADALEDYITAVGDLDGGFVTVDNLNLANSRVNGTISTVSNGKFCVDIISVSVGDFICYLAENNDSKMTSVTYNWKGPAGTKSGSGTIQVFAKSVHAMYSNRDEPTVKEINFLALTCKQK